MPWQDGFLWYLAAFAVAEAVSAACVTPAVAVAFDTDTDDLDNAVVPADLVADTVAAAVNTVGAVEATNAAVKTTDAVSLVAFAAFLAVGVSPADAVSAASTFPKQMSLMSFSSATFLSFLIGSEELHSEFKLQKFSKCYG